MSQLVSVLIPLFNAEKWLRETVESVLAQTWPNKEIIIVDDGSIDSSLQIAKQYESKMVKVVSQNNQGAPAARNKAFEHAQGDYIQWLDADDLLAPDKIERQIRAVESEGGWKTLLTASWAKFYYRYHKAKFKPDSLWQDLSPVEWLIIKFNENTFMNPATWLMSHRLAELSGPWDKRLIKDQDGEYICRVIARSEAVKFVPEARCYYRKSNPRSVSKDLSEKACESIFLAISLSIGYLRSLQDNDRTKAACLQLLQDNMGSFYPDHVNVLKKANDLAGQLGGRLVPPTLSWRYSLARKVLGATLAKKTKRTTGILRLLIAWNFDKLMYGLSKNKSGLNTGLQ